jgi:hypothetical protein
VSPIVINATKITHYQIKIQSGYLSRDSTLTEGWEGCHSINRFPSWGRFSGGTRRQVNRFSDLKPPFENAAIKKLPTLEGNWRTFKKKMFFKVIREGMHCV